MSCVIIRVNNLCFLFLYILLVYTYAKVYNFLFSFFSLVRLHSSGILKYLEKKWISRESPDSTDHKFSFKPVEHAHIRFIFLGLCFFIIISAVLCVFENVWYNLSTQIAKSLKVRKKQKLLKVPTIIGNSRKCNGQTLQVFIKYQNR